MRMCVVVISCAALLSTGCSKSEDDEASIASNGARLEIDAPIRLVQSGDTPGVEIIPTPTPDGVPDPKPETEPKPVPDAKPTTDPKSVATSPGKAPTEGTPEIVPAPEGIPEAGMKSRPGKPDETPGDPRITNPEMKGGTDAKDRGDPAIAVADRDAGPDLKATGPEDYTTWPTPNVALIITGQQNGYIEPCGCTGLDRQKGGLARRLTFMKSLQQNGWTLLPIDAGNQVRRFGRQAEIKFHQSAEALKKMKYKMVGFGPDDLRLGVGELLAVVAADSPETALYASANVSILDPSLMPQHKLVIEGGMRIAMTSVLDPDALEVQPAPEINIEEPTETARKALAAMAAESPDFRLITFYGKEKAAEKLVREVPGFDIVVVAGGYGEPTYIPQTIDGTQTKLIVTGNKGMYAGIVGLYVDQPMKYARVPLTHEFADAPEMRELMQSYQDQLEAVGLKGLGLRPIPHPSGEKFVGTAKCAECHTSAYDVWKFSDHAEATAHIVKPPKERGDIERHFDPECISCHVTGWNGPNYYPYESGYLSLGDSKHLTGNGCENCHGPGARHSEAEREDSGATEEQLEKLRLAMRLPIEKAKEKCMECHDLDNSPDFHVDDAFEDDYWPQVEHYGVD